MDRREFVFSGVTLLLNRSYSFSQETGDKRFALILANQTYEKNPLPNIDNDAMLMERTLKGLGFSVVVLMNGTRITMRTKLKELKDSLSLNPNSIGFVYYSGHGVQVDSENYLVPVNNGSLTTEADVKEDCLSLSYLLEMSKGTKAKAYIVVLDACRDNPFLGQKGDGSKGLAVVERGLDTTSIVAFAASPGETASATLGGTNSVYTAELSKQLQIPNLSIQEVFQTTRSAVRMKTSNKQRPREDNTLEAQLYLNGRLLANGKVSQPKRPLAEYPALKTYIESMCSIPSGQFLMGGESQSKDGLPTHNVKLSAYRLGVTPVSVALWTEYCKSSGESMPDPPAYGLQLDHPIVAVSWNDIMGVDGNGGFCAWVSEIAGYRFTLPTEAQWEYAARGGQSDMQYPWGNTFDRRKLWCSVIELGDVGTPASLKRNSNVFRNAYGLIDMVGNVWEWCLDGYAPYSSSGQTDPIGESPMNYRCIRGGSFFDFDPKTFTCANRGGNVAKTFGYNTGFRLAAGPG